MSFSTANGNASSLRTGAMSASRDQPAGCGFATAAGKGINISDSARAQAAALLFDDDDEPPAKMAKPTSVGGGFQMASGASVSLSTEARAKAAALVFGGDDEDLPGMPPPCEGQVTSTAGGSRSTSTKTFQSVAAKASHAASSMAVPPPPPPPPRPPPTLHDPPPRPPLHGAGKQPAVVTSKSGGKVGFKPPRKSDAALPLPPAQLAAAPASRVNSAGAGAAGKPRFKAPRTSLGGADAGPVRGPVQAAAAATTMAPPRPASRAGPSAQQRCECTERTPLFSRRCPICCNECGLTLEREGDVGLHMPECPNRHRGR